MLASILCADNLAVRQVYLFEYICLMVMLLPAFAINVQAKVSEETAGCLECHESILPGIV